MIEVRKFDYIILTDYDANAAYYDGKTEDKSPYPRNFSTQMRFFNPELTSFFSDLAIDIVKPDSLTWENAEDGEIIYTAVYSCRGKLGKELNHKIRRMLISGDTVNDGLFNITAAGIKLPWILLEPKDGEKPAAPAGFASKLKGFFKK